MTHTVRDLLHTETLLLAEPNTHGARALRRTRRRNSGAAQGKSLDQIWTRQGADQGKSLVASCSGVIRC